jgi:hypothetical protein
VASFQQTTTHFSSYSSSAMQARLRQEFGRELEVTSTGHYLVVHPRGQGRTWSGRFEELYRSFVHYFKVRGFDLQEPQFPLVAVVLPSQADFFRYTQQQGEQASPGLLGYYSPQTNRVAMYDTTAGRSQDSWSLNDETIIHEATHQTAFNTGIHSRYTASPRWVVEGLGTLFEAPGVWNSRGFPRQQDRINRTQLELFKRNLAAGRAEARFVELISSDRLFDSNSTAAYCEAWAFTFYLVETQPRIYAQYLERLARRPDFAIYPSAARLADFTAVFGENLKLLDARFLRFIDGVK